MRDKFEKDLTTGEIGENVIFELLNKSEKIASIIDTRKDNFFQNLDIDFLTQYKNGKVIKLEIKTDTLAHKTGNIVYELKSSKNSIGCFEKSKADYFIYYLTGNGEIYMFKPSKVKEYAVKNKLEVRKMGDYACGYVIPIKYLLRDKIICRIQQPLKR